MSSFISAAPVASGQVQSLDSLRGHSLPSDAMILASATQVNPTNQNTGSYAIVESGVNSLGVTTTGSVPAVTQSPFADLYKEGSLYFNGTGGNYINATATGLSGTQWNTTGLTVEAWVNYQSFTTAGSESGALSLPSLVGSFQSVSPGNYYWGFGANTLGYVTFTYAASPSVSIRSSAPLSTNTWNHIAFSCVPGGTTANIYVNGTVAVSSSISGTPQILSSTPLGLGQGQSASFPINCYVADVRITTGAALYTGASFTVPSAPLSTSASGVCQALIRAGSNAPYVSNGALTFDRGLKQFAQFGPQTFNIATRGFTALFRYTWNGTALVNERIFQAFTTAGSQNNSIQLTRNSTSTGLRFGYGLSGTYTFVDSASGLAQGTTYVVAFVYNASTGVAQWWVNGAPSGSAVTGLTSSITTDHLCPFTYMGASFDLVYFSNFSSNTFAIYNRALSNVEIYNSYLALNTVPATPQQKTLEIGDINGVPALSVAGNGQVSVQSIGLSSNVVPWPPSALQGYDTVINGGVYKARDSSEFNTTLFGAWQAFDKTNANQWSSGQTYSTSAPYAYTGTFTTTDVNGTVYPGEWLQIQLPNPVTVSSYSIYGVNGSNQMPGKWAVLGSRDGVNWFLVDSLKSSILYTAASGYSSFTVSSTQAYTYYRIVVNQISGNSTYQNVTIQEWTLYGTADASPTLTIAPATTFNTSVATPSLVGVSNPSFVPQDFSSSGLNIPAYVVSNTATVANTVVYSSFGPFAGEGSLYFGYPPTTTLNQCGAYVNLGPSAPPSFSPVGTPLTIEGWIYITGISGDNNYYTLWTHGSPNSGVGSAYDLTSFVLNGTFYFGLGSGISPTSVSVGGIVYNAWNHVSGSWNGTNTLYCSVNGTVASQAVTGTPGFNSAYSFLIGAQGGGYNMRGYVACTRFTRGQALYTTTFTPPTGPLQPIQGTTQAGLPYGTVLLLRNAPAPGRIQTTKFSGANSGQVLSFPPAAMTGYSTALNAGYGQGTYVASASNEFGASNLAWYAFNKVTSDRWGGQSGQYIGSGSAPYLYNGANPPKTVDVNGTAYSGDWIQLLMPSAIVLSSYSIYYDTTYGCPGLFYVFGSRDGTNWTLIDQRTQAQPGSSGYITFSVSSSQSFNYLRLVAYGLTTTGGTLNVPEITYNGTLEAINITSDGRVGLGVVNPTRALEVAGDIVCTGTVSSGTGLMFRNRIINGDMRIDQRAGGASKSLVLTTGVDLSYVTCDRWGTYFNGTVTSGTISQSTTVPPGAGFTSSIVVTAPTGFTSGTGAQAVLAQRIEGYQIADFGSGSPQPIPFTVSFWVRSSIAGTYGFVVGNGASSRSFVNPYQINNVNTWEYKTLQFFTDTTGSWGITSTAGMYIAFELGNGTSFETATPGVWVAGDYKRTSSCIKWAQTAGATFYVTGVQLEKGSVATPFETRPYATELALCQRYYEQSYSIGTAPGTSTGVGQVNVSGSSDGSSNFYFFIRYAVPKRTASAAPVFYLQGGTLGTWTYLRSGTTGAATVSYANNNEFCFSGYVNIGAAWTVASMYGHWVTNAEL